jgi:UDP-glucose 4-epimerase
MRVLVTGAGGFIGRHLVAHLEGEHEVLGLVRKSSSRPGSIQVDLSRRLDESRLPDRIDAVVHLAQSEHYRQFPERAADIYAVNVDSTFALLEYARKAGATRFVLASSGGVYGYSREPLTEDAALDPPDFYLASKQLCEVLLFAYRRFLTVIAVRPFFVYGAGQRPAMFIPRLVHNILAGKAITLSPPDGLRVNPIHVTDAVRAFAATLTADFAGAVNLAGPDVLTLGEIVRIIGKQLDRTPVIERVAEAPGDVLADIGLMSRVLGPPSVPFERGIVEVCREAAELATRGH